MKLLNEYEMSCWAYWECYYGNDIPEIWKLITDSNMAYWYCQDIKYRPEVGKHIIK